MAKKRARIHAKFLPVGVHERARADTLFIGFMFLGLAVGLAFNQTFPGLLIGVGLGILSRGFGKYKPGGVELTMTFNVAGYILALFGLYFIFLASALIYNVHFNNPSVASVPLIIIGLVLIILGYRTKK